MSRRTAEANKAIRLAWEQEKERVLEGKGTRDWTPEQQKDIVERGKAYDADGRAFEGHHMKSAEHNPDYQGEPGNIQFLTHQEHLSAHHENWQTPTNWYYNPVTKEYIGFEEKAFAPCEVIKLNSPVYPLGSPTFETEKDGIVETQNKEITKGQRIVADSTNKPSNTPVLTQVPSNNQIAKREPFAWKVAQFFAKHPGLKKGLEITGKVAFKVVSAIGVAGLAYATVKSSSDSSTKSSGSGNEYLPQASYNYDYKVSYNDDREESAYEDVSEASSGRNCPEKRKSPDEHIVPSHSQRYRTKDGIIRKEKDSYVRGKHQED